jgi:radical SAM superfamily enzyme YgiQ (UPF0313 family)
MVLFCAVLQIKIKMDPAINPMSQTLNKTKVLLYNISNRADMPSLAFVPLAFTFLESYIKIHLPSVEIRRHDYLFDDPNSKPCSNYFEYDLIGFQLTFANAGILMNLLEEWESRNSRPFIIVGGVFASAIAFELMRGKSYIDAVVIAEGEEPLLQLIRYHASLIDIKDIPGMVYRNQHGHPIYNKRKRSIEFDKLPIAKRTYLNDIDAAEIKKTSIRVQSARGCLGKCSFCLNSYKNRLDKLTTKVWRGKSPERTVEEIKYLQQQFGVQIVNFVDPSFEDPGRNGKKRIENIAKLIIENDLRISFKVNLRAETFTTADIDLLKLLKRAGMDIIVLGIEACNNEELELFGKNADIDTIKRAYWRLRDMDCFSLLIGYISIHPYSTIKSVRRSFEFLQELLIPLRGTNIYDKLKSDGLIINADKILEIPQYKFIDQRVARLNNAIQKIKIEYPVLNDLHQVILDAHNIIARSTNLIFDKLLTKTDLQKAFLRFKQFTHSICEELGSKYYILQMRLLEITESECDPIEIDKLVLECVAETAPKVLKHLGEEIDTYVKVIKQAGYDTSILESKSWGSFCQEKVKIGI